MTTSNQTNISPTLDLEEDQRVALLARHSVRITSCGATIDGFAETKLDLLPRPGIYLYCSFDQTSQFRAFFNVLSRSDSISCLEVDGRPLDGFIAKSNLVTSPQAKLDVKWCPAVDPISASGDEETEIHRVVFHLFNLRIGGTHVIDHVDLTADAWQIRICSLPTTRRDLELLREQGGYRLTHVGEVRTRDGGSFSGAEAKDLLEAIALFLTFVKGSRCDLCCPSGFDSSDEQVWSQWSAPREWEPSPLTWFDFHNPSSLANLFSGFMAKWRIHDWRDALRTAIWWFANANYSSRGADAGIIFAQTAMERLCYEYCVVDRALISAKGFNDLAAADKYRLILSSLAIPTGIPTSASALARAARRYSHWSDAPQALTEIRNRLVHSGKPRAQLPDSCYVDAWKVAVWFLEMTLLALCGFDGKHWNRNTGTLQSVPWAIRATILSDDAGMSTLSR